MSKAMNGLLHRNKLRHHSITAARERSVAEIYSQCVGALRLLEL